MSLQALNLDSSSTRLFATTAVAGFAVLYILENFMGIDITHHAAKTAAAPKAAKGAAPAAGAKAAKTPKAAAGAPAGAASCGIWCLCQGGTCAQDPAFTQKCASIGTACGGAAPATASGFTCDTCTAGAAGAFSCTNCTGAGAPASVTATPAAAAGVGYWI